MLSQTAQYALRAVVHIAEHQDRGWVRVDDTAEALAVPRNYLSKILHQLGREEILASARGPGGGFRLAVAAADLPLLRVVDVFDRIGARSGCLMGRPTCSEVSPCAAHARWKLAMEPLVGFFRQTSVADLADPTSGAGVVLGAVAPDQGQKRSARKGAGS